MSTASTPPTPENVAESLANNGGKYDHVDPWLMAVETAVNVVEIRVTSFGEKDSEQTTTHFRAVVVEGEDPPLVLEHPAELGLSWDDGGNLLALTAGGIRLYLRGVDVVELDPDEALELAAHLAAMAEARKAALADWAEAANGGGSE